MSKPRLPVLCKLDPRTSFVLHSCVLHLLKTVSIIAGGIIAECIRSWTPPATTSCKVIICRQNALLDRKQRRLFFGNIFVLAMVRSDEGVHEFGVVTSTNGRVRVQQQWGMSKRAASDTGRVHVLSQSLSRERDAEASCNHVDHFLRRQNMMQLPNIDTQ